MEFLHCEMPSFVVIGKEGLSGKDPDWIKKLWTDLNTHLEEVLDLALKDSNGNLAGFWGAMTDVSRSFLPWSDDLKHGYYLAGIQVRKECKVPKGWSRWVIPAFEYIYTKVEGDYDTYLKAGLDTLENQDLVLAGAIQEYNCPEEDGQLYLFFPIRRIAE